MSKNTVLNTYNFVSTANRQIQFDSNQYELIIRQQPKQARLCSSKERDRRPVDPPPIIQLKVNGYGDEAQNFLQSPYYFMCANLVHPTDSDSFTVSSRYLAGTVVSSLHKLKDIDNKDGGFFVFGDISVRVEGRYRLNFSLFEIIRDEVVHIHSVKSDIFTVYSPKAFPGMSESTFLSRSFSDQGVRIRIRKEHRIQMKRPQSNSRQSDTVDCDDDNINDDGIIDTPVKRKRTSMEMFDNNYSSSTSYPPSQQSPYPPPSHSSYSHHQYSSRQRQGGGSLSYPLPYSQQYNPPQRSHSYYEDSERESSSHDDHTSSSSYYNHEQYEQSMINKRPRLSNSEMSSYDYRQQSSTTPLNNNQYIASNHHYNTSNTSSPPLPSSTSSYRTPRRGITLSPLLENQLSYNTSSANNNMFNHSSHSSSLPPVRHHSFDVLTSAATPNTTTSLDSNFHYPTTTTTSSTTHTTRSPQIIPPSESFYRPPSSSLSTPLYPPKPPVRSRTLPIFSRNDNLSNNRISDINNISNDNNNDLHHHPTSLSPSNQLPTPKTSYDVDGIHNHNKNQLYTSYPPLTPPNPSSVDSYKNGNNNSNSNNNNSNNSNNLTPRFTQQFTVSPRPAPLQIPKSNNNNDVITRTNSLPVMSSNTSSSNTTTTFNGGAITSSPKLLPTNNNLPRLPPITSLTNSIDFIINKPKEQEVTAQQYHRNSYNINDWHNNRGVSKVNNGNYEY